jgi:hypothetical protein
MKVKNLIVLSFFSLIIVLSSCKKDEQSIENPELDLSNSSSHATALTTSHPGLSISCRLAPEDVTDMSVTVKITSNADPDGLEIVKNVASGSYSESGTKYLYVSFNETIYVANHTNTEKKKIKVSELGDTVKVIVGNNIIEKKLIFVATEQLSYTFFANDFAGSLTLHGYSYDGTENKQVEVWSTRDDQKVPIDGEYNDPSAYQALPNFNSFSFWIPYNNGWSYPADTLVGIYPISDLDPDGDTIFIKYQNKTYFTPYFEHSWVLRLYQN